MLCRSEKSFKVSGNGHLNKWLQTYFNVGLAGLVARLTMAALMGFMGLIAPSHAQGTTGLNNPGQLKIDAQLKPWFANIEHVSESSVSVSLLDYRLKIEPCEKPISFDFPFASHKTVRARCDSPAWQYYLQVSVNNASATNTSTATSSPNPPSPPTTTANTSAPGGSAPSKTPPQPSTGASEAIKSTQSDPAPAKPASQNPLNTGMHTVLTSPQFLKRGTILEANMFVGTEVALQPSEMSALSNPKDVVNMELLRDLPANTPLKSFDLKPMVMIKRGQLVIVSIGEGKGFLISIRAEALQDGQLGDQIRLKNTESGRSISAVVTGVNTAKAM